MKKVLYAILIVFIVMCMGLVLYYSYIYFNKEKSSKDEQETIAYEELEETSDEETSEQDTMMSLPSTSISLSDDASLDEVRDYLLSLTEDELNEVENEVLNVGNNIEEYNTIKSNYAGWEYIVLDEYFIKTHDIKDLDSMHEELISVLDKDELAEKKLEVINSVLRKYALTETKQKFEYYGLQTGRFIVTKQDDTSEIYLWYVSEDNIETILNETGYIGYLIIKINKNGDLSDYTDILDEIIPLVQSVQKTCSLDSKYKLYVTIRKALDSINNDELNLGEMLGDSGQL